MRTLPIVLILSLFACKKESSPQPAVGSSPPPAAPSPAPVEKAPEPPPPAEPAAVKSEPQAPPAAPAQRLDLNTATQKDLEGLPDVGETKAKSIIASRNARGGQFESIDDVAKIDGIGPKTVDGIRSRVMLLPKGGKLDLNRATQKELEGLPEIGPVHAKSIIASRNARGGHFESVDDLMKIDGIGPKTVEAIRPYVVLKPKK